MIEELENINEQAIEDDEITKGAVIEALTDLIRDAKGNDFDLIFDDADDFTSYEETDFTDLDYSNNLKKDLTYILNLSYIVII